MYDRVLVHSSMDGFDWWKWPSEKVYSLPLQTVFNLEHPRRASWVRVSFLRSPCPVIIPLAAVFVYGNDGRWAPEIHTQFPRVFERIVVLILMAVNRPAGEREGFLRLDRHVWECVFSHMCLSDYEH
eukprot:TRINITY_DN19780_c0_g1_i2.p2 TRINITY_DN19780_c0_g1~~TRINITY_DN19780_c0_g1_i2.p2  ORF type:complete len:127 (-),score=10.79 TRINITY_DN19780_c0_g1_i2:98-478(-)